MSSDNKKTGKKQSADKSAGFVLGDNLIQPFRLENSNVRGRMVRVGSVLADMMRRHNYPAPVSALLSEVVTLGLLLSAMLKYDGIFSLQIKGEGPITLLVADVTTRGDVRAYAGFDEAAVKKAAKRKQDTENHYYHLLGNKGYIAFTVDQGGGADSRYQGIVELKGTSIVDSVQHYFSQSEQIRTSFRIAVHPQDDHWRAGGIMIQHMPEDDAGKYQGEVSVEDWARAVMFLDTCTDGEILSPVLPPQDVLYRLFNEDGVRVYPVLPIHFKCRCSLEKVTQILKTIPRHEMEEICEKEGQASIKCEFCSENYIFTKQQLDKVYEENANDKS